jgi:hypothetical protein
MVSVRVGWFAIVALLERHGEIAVFEKLPTRITRDSYGRQHFVFEMPKYFTDFGVPNVSGLAAFTHSPAVAENDYCSWIFFHG